MESVIIHKNTGGVEETSYVWGAPGTGKTQFVLATAMRENIFGILGVLGAEYRFLLGF